MHFTQEDYIKIENWLHRNSVKDTEFQEALPFTGKEIVTVVQDGHNRKVNIQEFINQLYKHGVEDFLNVTNTYKANNITLKEAIRLIPAEARKEGQVITFLNTDGNWEIYQFIGKLNQWNNPTLWNNPFDWEKLIVDSILPDEEDLTKSAPDAKGNSYLSLKDRKYEPDKYSGLGRKILRRRVVEIEDPIYGTQEKNLLLQADFAEDNTVYVVRHDFTLNGQDITLPDNSYIEYEGGSISDGNIIDRAGGLNRIILKKNIVNGKNILIQSMINKENTIYEIRYDFDLNENVAIIPNECILYFNGGKLINGNIVFNNTRIISDAPCFDNIKFSGIISQTIKASWFTKFSEFINLANLSKKGLVDSEWKITNNVPYILNGTDLDLGGNVITHGELSTDALFALANDSRIHNGEINGIYKDTTMSTLLLGVESKKNMNFIKSNNVIIENITLRHNNSTWQPNSQMDSSIYIEGSGYANVRLCSVDIISARCGVLFHFSQNITGGVLRWLTDVICHDIYVSYSEYGFKVDNDAEWLQFSGCVFDGIKLVAFSDASEFNYRDKDSIGFLMTAGPNIFTNITHFNDVGIDHRLWQPTIMHFDALSKQNIVENVLAEGYYIEDYRESGIMNLTNNVVYTTFGGIRTSLDAPTHNKALNRPIDFEITERAKAIHINESGTREAWTFASYILPESNSTLYERGSDENGDFIDVSLAEGNTNKLILVRSNAIKLDAFGEKGFAKVLFKLGDNSWLPTSSLTFDSVTTILHAVLNDGRDVIVKGGRTALYDEKKYLFSAFQSWDFNDTINTESGVVGKYEVAYLYYQIGFVLGETRKIRIYRDSIILSKAPIFSNKDVEYVVGSVRKIDEENYSLIDWDNKPYVPSKYESYCDTYFPNAVANLCHKNSNIIYESYGSEVKAYYLVGRGKVPIVTNTTEELSIIYNGIIEPIGMRGSYIAFISSSLKKYTNGKWTEIS